MPSAICYIEYRYGIIGVTLAVRLSCRFIFNFKRYSNILDCHFANYAKLITNSKAPDNPSKNDVSDTESKADDNAVAATSQDEPKERIDFKIIYNKQKIDVNFPLDDTVKDLKAHLQDIIAVPQAMQKVMIKGLAKDEQTLRSLGVTKGAKIMIVGSKLNDVLAVSIPTKQDLVDEATASARKEPLSQQKMHRKVLDKGIPEDAMPGILDSKDSLPDYPLAGMLNKSGGKVRLTFKLEQDQLWIGTKQRTDKIPMNSIKGVLSEPIHDHPEYHIMAIQLGPTEASRYWIYWVPAQYVSAIKDSILGKWQYF
ncbi:ubiquitin domain-containing protein UBFD1-like isoform X2 [Diprion similis]|uniref:ubiquitin domain-containing protein UBFD1-like isoform X2 n=1 Tax=Diprion similis TaxID=362088 RepID=UPI001EF96AC3|nr:ubiquitin domain-containing protein UBFD1-like isoform X2 [Diprion similis]